MLGCGKPPYRPLNLVTGGVTKPEFPNEGRDRRLDEWKRQPRQITRAGPKPVAMNPAPLPELDIIEQDEDVDITHQTKVASKGQEIGLHGGDAVHLRLIGCALRREGEREEYRRQKSYQTRDALQTEPRTVRKWPVIAGRDGVAKAQRLALLHYQNITGT